jgi:hypothetical protein
VEEDIRMRLRMRDAQTRASNEPAIRGEWIAAHETRNDPARRAALKVYYNHLFDRMIQLDPTIADRVNARREAEIQHMYYPRLGDEAPSDDPFATPTPAAEGPNPPPAEEPLVY